jgi:hypothetical protein
MNRNVTEGNDTELLAAKIAAQLIPGSASYQSLLRWARQGKVPFVRLPSGRMFFRRSDIEALLTPVELDPEGSSGVPFVDAPLPGFEVEAVPA